MFLHDDTVTDACEDAVAVFGEAQIGLCQEECAELIQALSKYQRSRNGQGQPTYETVDEIRANIIEEIGDVLIMLYQMQVLLEIQDYEILWTMKLKTKRIEDLVREA